MKSSKYAHVWATFVCNSFISMVLSGPNFLFSDVFYKQGCRNFFCNFTGLWPLLEVLMSCGTLCSYTAPGKPLFLAAILSAFLFNPDKSFISKHRFNTLQCSSACVSRFWQLGCSFKFWLLTFWCLLCDTLLWSLLCEYLLPIVIFVVNKQCF